MPYNQTELERCIELDARLLEFAARGSPLDEFLQDDLEEAELDLERELAKPLPRGFTRFEASYWD